MVSRIKWSLVYLPDDLGVFHVGGKTGARFGPEAFDRFLRKFRGKFDALETLAHHSTFNTKNGKIRDHLDQAAALVAQAYVHSQPTVVVGGGHDFGYSFLKGVTQAAPGKKISCLNLDAHFDLRKPAPEITSGSPFYIAIEEGILDPRRFTEFGIQSHCNAQTLWEYAESKQIHIVPFETIRTENRVERFRQEIEALASKSDIIALSVDLDCVSQAFAPGVSAPQAEGFTSDELIEMCEIAGQHPQVQALGIFELNPLFDIEERTARLAATGAFHFLEAKNRSI